MENFCECTYWRTPESIPAPSPAPTLGSIPVSATESQNQTNILHKKCLDEETCMNILNLHITPEMIKAKNILCSTSVKESDKNGFSCVLSMQDAKVMYTTASITTAIGFSRGMWIGRPFIYFVHPKDHNLLESQFSNGIVTTKSTNSAQLHEQASVTGEQLSTMVCRIRRYNGLNSLGSKEKVITYKPFMLKFFFKTLTEEKEEAVYLVIECSALFSAFTTPNEVVIEPMPFVIRHSPNGKLDHIDIESVRYLGYMPQDIAQKDMLLLYYPSDLIYLRHVYETIMREGGLERSKPYRMKAQNGDFLKLETEWSSFINPLSKKLEYVIAKHFIIEGPKNPDVFQTLEPAIYCKTPCEEDAKAQTMRDYIVSIMNKEPDLEIFDSISSHYDYIDTHINNETPISYNQVNNDDNLLRFFDKHEAYTVEEINALAISENESIEKMTVKSPDVVINSSPKDMDKIGSISGSAVIVPDTISECSVDGYQSLELTEALMNKHNVEMQQELLKIHSKACFNKSERALNDSKQRINEHIARCNAPFQPTAAALINVDQTHGIKRPAKDADEHTEKHRCTSSRYGTIKPHVPPLPSFSYVYTSTLDPYIKENRVMIKQMKALSPTSANSKMVNSNSMPLDMYQQHQQDNSNNLPLNLLHQQLRYDNPNKMQNMPLRITPMLKQTPSSEQMDLSSNNNEEFPQVGGQKTQLNVDLQGVTVNRSLDKGITTSSCFEEEISNHDKASTSDNPLQNRAFNSVMVYEDNERLLSRTMSDDSGYCSS